MSGFDSTSNRRRNSLRDRAAPLSKPLSFVVLNCSCQVLDRDYLFGSGQKLSPKAGIDPLIEIDKKGRAKEHQPVETWE